MRDLDENHEFPKQPRDNVIVSCSNSMASLVAGLVILSICLKRSSDGRLTTLVGVVINISAADLLSSIGFTMSAFTRRYYDASADNLTAKESGVCRMQAIFIQYLLASFLWSACFAHLMYKYVKAKVDRKETLGNQGVIWTYGVISWGGAFLSILISGSIEAFGPTATTWCWMGQDFKTYRVIIFYIPLLICIFCGILAIALSHRYVRKRANSTSIEGPKDEDHFNYDSLEFLPQGAEEEPILPEDPLGVALELAPFVLVFILVWALPAVNRFYIMIEGSENRVLGFIEDLFSPMHGMFNATILLILVREVRPRAHGQQREEQERDVSELPVFEAAAALAGEPNVDGTTGSMNDCLVERFEVDDSATPASSRLRIHQEKVGIGKKATRLFRKYIIPMALCYLSATHLFLMNGEMRLTRDFSPFLKIFVQAASGAITCGTLLGTSSYFSLTRNNPDDQRLWDVLAPFLHLELAGAMIVLSLLILEIPLLLVMFAQDAVNTSVISSCTSLIPVITVFLKFILIQSVENAPNTRMFQSFQSDDEGAVTVFSKVELVSKENIKFQKRIIAVRLLGYLVAVVGAFVMSFPDFSGFRNSEIASGIPFSIMLAICWSLASIFNKVCCAEVSPLAKAFFR
eukprot:gb/GECG01005884.1/.p1 GENE.gb/GECG01005884.1/~~gb/GECG01005884.1/.p1  ORF type:complete len:632 (+),score=38.66 gb/GECG01005884.1/:1-1896(+)